MVSLKKAKAYRSRLRRSGNAVLKFVPNFNCTKNKVEGYDKLSLKDCSMIRSAEFAVEYQHALATFENAMENLS